jgi:hypothetical protein
MSLRRIGLSWWRDGLGGGEVLPPLPSEADEAAEADESRLAGITQHFSRVLRLDARPAPPSATLRRAAEFQYRGPDLTKTLPADLKARAARAARQNASARRRSHGLRCAFARAAPHAPPRTPQARLVIFYLDPRSFAALACTCRAWRALSVGANALWRDKLAVLQLLWPDAGLPSDEGIITYYRVGGTDATAWARRYAKAQATAPKLSATACECAGSEGFRTRLFGAAADEHGACARADAPCACGALACRPARALLPWLCERTLAPSRAA